MSEHILAAIIGESDDKAMVVREAVQAHEKEVDAADITAAVQYLDNPAALSHVLKAAAMNKIFPTVDDLVLAMQNPDLRFLLLREQEVGGKTTMVVMLQNPFSEIASLFYRKREGGMPSEGYAGFTATAHTAREQYLAQQQAAQASVDALQPGELARLMAELQTGSEEVPVRASVQGNDGEEAVETQKPDGQGGVTMQTAVAALPAKTEAKAAGGWWPFN